VRRNWLVVLFICVVASSGDMSGTETPRAVAQVDSAEYLVGDLIRVSVEITHSRGTTFQSLLGDTIGGYSVLDRFPFELANDSTTRTGFVVARYDSGTSELPPLPFLVSVPGDTAARRVETNPLRLTVHTLNVKAEDPARDLKPPMGIPYTLLEILVFVGVLVLLALAGYLLYRFLKRRGARSHPEAHVSPERPAHVAALEELANLRGKKLWQQGRIKEYYSELTEILRRYFENRYGLMALEETTDEILVGLRELHLRPAVSDEIEEVLRRADLVKFAKHKPVMAEHEQTLKQACTIVEKTRAPATPPMERPRAKATDHVET
jgi:hypothetical protein